MKVRFVYSAIGIAGFNPDRSMGDREGSWIGHGVTSVATCTKQAGHDVGVIDLRHLGGWEDLTSLVLSDPAEVYGISVAPVDYPYSLQAVYTIKRALPQAKIIIGGIYPSIFPGNFDFEVIDTVVAGEGEITFPKLLEDIDHLPKFIQGEKPDLDRLPFIDRDLWDYDRELNCFFAPDQKLPSITMLAGRGCPYKCAYCQPAENAVFGKPFRIRSPINVLQELEGLYERYSYKSITFWDDTFTFSREFCMQFANLYEESGINATIAACSRADIICKNEDMIARLAEVGVDWLVIGFESGSQRLLDLIKKGTTVEQNYLAAAICRKHGIKVFGTHMYGLPTETPAESRATAMMMDNIHPEMSSPFWYTPIPGTGLYEFCKGNDLIISDDGNIARTGQFRPTLKGIDYDLLYKILEKRQICAIPETRQAA